MIKIDNNTPVPLISHSSRNDFISCRLKFYYRKICGISVRDDKVPEEVKLGAIWDHYIESRYNKSEFDLNAEVGQRYVTDIGYAKLNGLINAFKALDMQIDRTGFVSCQHEFNIDGVRGFLDRAYTDHIVETKLSGQPRRYLDIFQIENQVGTYFLSNPAYKYVIMEVTQTPQLRLKKNETVEEFSHRIYSDVIASPLKYFPGFNRKTRTFGKKFYRKDFNLHRVAETYNAVKKDIKHCIENDLWYDNRSECGNMGRCWYYPICNTGTVNDNIYVTKKPKG